ncbi:CheW-like domain protein [Aquisphaera giovannonii]|uniref:CheW-like domain protein n=1 Tax=Aquisphaera giovannonii TaxID=406548 RepID=A0A5B9VUY5_9BACT|nr:chemotaxis protein CheW [Aquisphaera giovannonii]QEH31894.1 CheW-like domain protein [Aquisphaera giovannonii]
MLLLTFRAAGSRYAVDVSRIVEVVPRVELRALPHAPGFLLGVFDFRGRVVPVVDLGLLLGGPGSSDRLSTRVVLVDARPPGSEPAGAPGAGPEPGHDDAPEADGSDALTVLRRRAGRRSWLLGLLAEHVIDVAAVKPSQTISARMQLPQSPYLGPIVEVDQEMVQLVAAEHVLGPALRDAFFAGEGAGGGGPGA